MLSKPTATLLGGMLLFFNSVAQAELELNAGSINLRSAISQTFKHNPALRSFSYQLDAQAGRALQASLSASPEININIDDALGTGTYKGTDKSQTTLSIGWVVEGEIRQAYIDVAQAESLSLSTELKIKRLDAAAETARLYLICLANQVRLVNAKQSAALATETVRAVSKRVTAGKTPEAELARAQAELARKQLAKKYLENKQRAAIRLLAAQWGVTQPAFSKVDGELFSLPPPLSFEALKARLEQNPDFIRLLSNKRLKQAELKLARTKSSSEWQVNFGVRHFEASNDQALVAGISIPFGERSRNKGGITEAQANLSQVSANETALRLRIETSLYILHQQLQHSLHRVEVYQNTIIPQLEKALKETRRAYFLGRYSYLEWRSVQADLLSARSSLVEDSFNAHLNIIEIERLTGMRMAQAN